MIPLEDLKARLVEADDLTSAAALLRWDQLTYMPPGGSPARGRQMATLNRLAHEKFTDVALGRLLDTLERETLESDDAALVRVTRRLYERLVRIPASLVSEINEHAVASYAAWKGAREANDFEIVRPSLEKTLDLSRRQARRAASYEHIADPLLERMDYGLRAKEIRQIFAALRARLTPLVRAIAACPLADDSCLHQPAPAQAKLDFGLEVIKAYGFDFARGRQDLTAHAFQTKFSIGDVRIATSVRDDHLTGGLFPTLHECGHALYEQGIRREFEGTPLANGTSLSIHESQSRLWENMVGRSLAFWEHFYPRLQAALPTQLGGVALDTFYRAINRVERTLLRGAADEVTYSLHAMLRFDLELDLLEGRLEVKDLKRAWCERFEADFGIPVPDDRHGVLQDVHWYSALVGGEFQSYPLGNIMSAQFHAAALAAHPEIPDEIAKGQFGTLRAWLTENVYQHGATLTTPELLRHATGSDLSIEPYLDYLSNKYRPLYGLS
jgi:carboxypeptidase Taq